MIKLRKFKRSDYDCFGGVESSCPLICDNAVVSGNGWVEDAVLIVDDLNISIYTGFEGEALFYKTYNSVGELLFDLTSFSKVKEIPVEEGPYGFKSEIL